MRTKLTLGTEDNPGTALYAVTADNYTSFTVSTLFVLYMCVDGYKYHVLINIIIFFSYIITER